MFSRSWLEHTVGTPVDASCERGRVRACVCMREFLVTFYGSVARSSLPNDLHSYVCCTTCLLSYQSWCSKSQTLPFPSVAHDAWYWAYELVHCCSHIAAVPSFLHSLNAPTQA